ncbi:hypothetical protein ACHAWC_005823 [Mediolabrus comicus]
MQKMEFREYNSSTVSSSSEESDSFLLTTKEAKNSTARLVWCRHDVQTVEAKARSLVSRLKQVGRDLFLPVGYPDSVADGYLEYQFYDSLQGLCTYLRGVVSTSALLSAAGVGNAEATAMSAAMAWAIRDGFGMIGGLLFSYKASPHFDAHVKEFRLLADVFNDVGLTIDLALPVLLAQTSSIPSVKLHWILSALSGYLPSSYLLLTSTSTLCKVACGICAGATKGNITDHFAISGNRADVNAKENTQETLVSLLGMCMGVGLAKWLHYLEKNDESTVEDNIISLLTNAQFISWTVFVILTMVHIWANYVGIQRLNLRTLNRPRAKVLLQPVIESCGNYILSIENSGIDMNRYIMETCASIKSPQQVEESLWTSLLGMCCKGNIEFGIRLQCLTKVTAASWSQALLKSYFNEEFGHNKYVILIDEKAIKPYQTKILVLMKVGSNDFDELKAFINAHILLWCLQRETEQNRWRLILRSRMITDCLFRNDEYGFDLYNRVSKSGWDMSKLYLGFSPWKCEWNNKDD